MGRGLGLNKKPHPRILDSLKEQFMEWIGVYCMVVIKCARCMQKIFKYEKIGKGRILH